MELGREMKRVRAEEMALLDGYAKLLGAVGHTAKVFSCSTHEMLAIRMKSARHIYNQLKKGRKTAENSTFHPEAVNTPDIRGCVRFDSGLLFPEYSHNVHDYCEIHLLF